MHPDIERLIALQAQDLEGKRMREELQEAPRRVLAAEKALATAQAAVRATEESLKKEEALRRRLESDVADRRTKIARLRKQMDNATSTAQVAALEHEISFAEKAIVGFEDEELGSMERTEAHEADLVKARMGLERATAGLASERERAAAVLERNTAALREVEVRRAELRSQVSEGLLATYDRVSKAKGTGVSEAVDHKCSACQMMVRPQRWNDLADRANQEAIFTCETCGRVLWYDPRRDAPVDWAPGKVG